MEAQAQTFRRVQELEDELDQFPLSGVIRSHAQLATFRPHPDKRRLLELGRYAAVNRQSRGRGRPETFTRNQINNGCVIIL